MRKENRSMKVVQVRRTERRVPLTEKTCLQCGNKFMGMKVQLYCSKRCSNMAAYWRHPDIYKQKRMESYRRLKKQAD